MITLDELHKSSQDLDMVGAWLAIQRDLLSRLAAAATLNEALGLCLEAATQAARMERGRLYVFDGPGGSLKLVAHQNLPDDLREAVKLLPADSPIAQGLNITAPIYQPHVYTQWDLTGGDAELRSAAIVPVFHQKQRAAILHLGTAHHDQVQKYAAIPLETIAQMMGGLLGQFQSRTELKSLKSHAQSQLEQTRSLADTILEQTDAFAYTQLQQLTTQFTQSLAELKSQQASELARLRQESQSLLAHRHTAQAERQTELKTISIQTQAALKQLENNLQARLDSLHNESSQTLAQTEAAMQSGWQDAQSQLTLMLMEIKTRAEADVRQLARQAEENRAHHQANYQHLLNSVSDWVWAVDTEGNFTASNPAITPLLGYRPGQVIGRPVFDFIHPADRARIQAIFVQTIMKQSVEKQTDWTGLLISWLHQDGTTRASQSTLFPLFDAQGYLTGFQGIDQITTAAPIDTPIFPQIKAVANIIEQTGAAQTVADLLKTAVSALQSGLDLYHAQIYLLDKTSQMLTMQACAGPAADFLRNDQAVPLNHERNLISQAARHNERLLRNNPGASGEISGHPLLPDTRSRLLLPLAIARRVEGVLDLHHTAAHYFGPDNATLLGLLAAHLTTMLTVVELRLAEQQAQAQQRQVERQLIEARQAALTNLPTPIIPVLGQIIAAPLVGRLDAGRSQAIAQAVLAGAAAHQARVVVLDVSGLSAADSGEYLPRIVQTVQAQGVQTIVTGGPN